MANVNVWIVKRQFTIVLCSIFLCAFFSKSVFAADPLKAKESGPKEPVKPKSNVLDFEADVIEGERVAPNLFVQMDLGAPKMDTLMFQRKNFNDFHSIDMKRKPKYRVKGK
jgi:hypothetical protein